MLKFVDLNFHAFSNALSLKEAVSRFKTSYGYIDFLKEKLHVEIIFHFEGKEETEIINGVNYRGFAAKNSFFHIPFKTLKHLREMQPDIVLVQGLVYPLQIMFLRFFLKKNQTKIMVQHHGGFPFTNPLKLYFQRLADNYVSQYLFTTKGNATPWQNALVIKDRDKVVEVIEGASVFNRQNKTECRIKLNIIDGITFLWIGRLDKNKDPFTVLKGFEKYVSGNPRARLYMIYHIQDLLKEVEAFVSKSEILKQSVYLVGEVKHEDIAIWLSAADFYISGSHNEGSGYALIEAMACGCIPVVTDIPSFRKITGEGRYGLLFEPGNEDDLVQKLLTLDQIDKEKFSAEVEAHFQKELSFNKIADDIYDLCISVAHH